MCANGAGQPDAQGERGGRGRRFRLQRGLRTKQVVLVVMVDSKVPLTDLRSADVIPNEIDGVPVDVQETGEFSIHS